MIAVGFADWSANDAGFLSSIIATVAFKCLIQGVLIAAVGRYFAIVHKTKDSVKMRWFVATVTFFELLHVTISIAKLYLVAVDRVSWGRHWLNPCDTTLNGTICFIVQLFFAHRCWRVTRKSTFILCILVFVISSIFAGTVGIVVIQWLNYRQFTAGARVLQIFIYIWGFSSACFELLVSIVLIRFLWNTRTGIQGLDKVVLRLLTICIESSFPCLIFVLILNLTVFLEDVSANFFTYSTASVYGLSLMMSINCREKIRNHLSEHRHMETLIQFAETGTNAMTESQMFSEEGLATRRASHTAGHDVVEQYRRPSILSFVKEAVVPSPLRPKSEM